MKKYTRIIFAILAVCLLVSLTACKPKTPASNTDVPTTPPASDSNIASQTPPTSDTDLTTDNYLRMGTNAFFEPYEFYENNEIVGIDAEIAAAIAKELGMILIIEDMEFESILVAINNGSVDMGMAGMTVTEERLLEVNFSTSYATGIQSIIVKENSDIKDPDDLVGKKIGVQLATTGDFYASDDYGDENVERYPKGSEAVMALLNGTVDCVIIDNEPAKSFVAANPGLKVLETEYAVEDYAIAIAKNNTELLDKVNTALAKLIANGTVQAIVDKYITAQ